MYSQVVNVCTCIWEFAERKNLWSRAWATQGCARTFAADGGARVLSTILLYAYAHKFFCVCRKLCCTSCDAQVCARVLHRAMAQKVCTSGTHKFAHNCVHSVRMTAFEKQTFRKLQDANCNTI